MGVIVIDVETTGLDPTRHEMIEIGLASDMFDGGGVAWSVPFDESKADPRALEVNGWGKREFAKQVAPQWLVGWLSEVLNGATIVASPAHFDLGFLHAFFSRLDLLPTWSHRSVVDLKSYACGRLGLDFGLKNTELSQVLGVEDTSDHSALNDALWTYRMFKAVDKILVSHTEGG